MHLKIQRIIQCKKFFFKKISFQILLYWGHNCIVVLLFQFNPSGVYLGPVCVWHCTAPRGPAVSARMPVVSEDEVPLLHSGGSCLLAS